MHFLSLSYLSMFCLSLFSLLFKHFLALTSGDVSADTTIDFMCKIFWSPITRNSFRGMIAKRAVYDCAHSHHMNACNVFQRKKLHIDILSSTWSPLVPSILHHAFTCDTPSPLKWVRLLSFQWNSCPRVLSIWKYFLMTWWRSKSHHPSDYCPWSSGVFLPSTLLQTSLLNFLMQFRRIAILIRRDELRSRMRSGLTECMWSILWYTRSTYCF